MGMKHHYPILSMIRGHEVQIYRDREMVNQWHVDAPSPQRDSISFLRQQIRWSIIRKNRIFLRLRLICEVNSDADADADAYADAYANEYTVVVEEGGGTVAR